MFSASIFCANAQETIVAEADTLVQINLDTVGFKPNPTRSVLFSAICPGLGQIYNRKYWKLPLVYGSFMGCIYAITWNQTTYSGYKRAFMDFNKELEHLPNDGAWRDYISSALNFPQNVDDWTDYYRSWFKSSLKNKKDYYRHYRDMSYIVTVAIYAIWMVDAYVDAQLAGFDVSPDLSMKIKPKLFEPNINSGSSLGLAMQFSF